MLVCPLQVREEVGMQGASFRPLHAAEYGIAPAREAALWLSVTPECVLAWVVPHVAMRAVGTHPHAQQTRKDDADIHRECVDSAQRVAREDEALQVVL